MNRRKTVLQFIFSDPDIQRNCRIFQFETLALCTERINKLNASGSRSGIIDMCTIHTCIRVKDRGTLINASYMHASGSRIMDKGIIGMYTYIRVKNHTYMHALGSRSRIIDMCIIHTCIRVKDWGTLINTWIYASYMHVRASHKQLFLDFYVVSGS